MPNIGSRIIATRTIGPIKQGTRGIVAAVAQSPFLYFWSRRVYLCTFAGHITLAVRPNEIEDCEQSPAQWRSMNSNSGTTTA